MASVLEAPGKRQQTSTLAASAAILPLESGASLSALEFLRRYEAMPEVKKAELIDGVVFMGSPVSNNHSEPDNLCQTWLGLYAYHTPGVCVCSNGTIRF